MLRSYVRHSIKPYIATQNDTHNGLHAVEAAFHTGTDILDLTMATDRCSAIASTKIRMYFAVMKGFPYHVLCVFSQSSAYLRCLDAEGVTRIMDWRSHF